MSAYQVMVEKTATGYSAYAPDLHGCVARALEKAGFKVVRQSGHVVLSNGSRFVVVPRNNPINAFTMGGIVKDAGFTVDDFRQFL